MTTVEALKAKRAGPMPSGRKWKDMSVPFFFNEEAAEAFQALETCADDVVCTSPVKAGTTWVHKILMLMLHGLDDAGEPVEPASEVLQALLKSQIYPDALPMTTPTEPSFMGGKLSYPDLIGMPAPRHFTTHFPGQFLPAKLMEPASGAGRLIIVLRNPKDVCTSLHFFRGEAKDGWLGNEHGPGSIARFCSPECPNAYGSVFSWLTETEKAAAPLIASGRCLVVYYERLKLDLPAELERIAAFLQCPLPPAKRDALAAAVSFSSMSGQMTSRKGEIGDWKNHLSDAEWEVFDQTIAETLAGSTLYEPLAEYAKR